MQCRLAESSDVLRVQEIAADAIKALARRYSIAVEYLDAAATIKDSYWGAPEAGISHSGLTLRSDTPVHSLLHELCHIVCMTGQRRVGLVRDAGGDDLEESGVCYLQVVLAGYLRDCGRERLMRDMDAWGYSFRLGSTENWFLHDAEDAIDFLINHRLMTIEGRPTFRLRA